MFKTIYRARRDVRSAGQLSTIAFCFVAVSAVGGSAAAETLRVMTTGLGSGTVTGAGINCGDVGAPDCNEAPATAAPIILTAAAAGGSIFAGWGGDCPDTDAATPAYQCSVPMNAYRSVRAAFAPGAAILPLTEAEIGDVEPTRSGIGDYLAAHSAIDTPAEFVAALPEEYRRNWILMSRSESLQTGTAATPRILLPNTDGSRAFSIGLREHASYPAAYLTAVEYMQWDDVQKTFRFHEIDLTAIPDKGDDIDPGPGVTPRFPGRPRGFVADDQRCFACHSTRNVINRGATPGTDGLTPGTIPVKNKPNWDAYDSWGGQLGFNRDRIYKGSIEAAAFRKMFNLWNWRDNPPVRRIVEQLQLQPPGVPDGSALLTRRHNQDFGGFDEIIADDRITRLSAGGADDGRIVFGFDPPGAPVTTEPAPAGSTFVTIGYQFDRRATPAGTGVLRTPTLTSPSAFVTLHHSISPRNDAGRGVFFLTNMSDIYNTQRVVDEVKTHRFATGNVPIDVRPLALSIAAGCITVTGGPDIAAAQSLSPALSPAALAFFDARNGMNFNDVYDDTRRRQTSLPLRKADIHKMTLDRTADPYVYDENGPSLPPAAPEAVNGLIQEHGAGTAGVTGGTGGLDTSFLRLRQEIFRRPIDRGGPDQTVMGGVIVDREDYREETVAPLALFRYFLEPLGVSVDKWSTGVRGRSRSYSFSASFGSYIYALSSAEPGGLRESLGIPEAITDVCPIVTPMVDALFASLPAAGAVPTYTDIQRILNKSCIECHGGLGYPPYRNYGDSVNFSENENPAPGERRLWRSLQTVRSLVGMPGCAPSTPSCLAGGGIDPSTSYLYQRITDHGMLAHPYNPAEPYDGANPDNPADPDVADERCPDGLMPCGGPPLSKVDIETIRRWIIGGAPNAEGDPHIKTVEGVRYDFQSAGEFVLLREEGMELQARQTPVSTAGPLPPNAHTGLSSCVSVNTALALRAGQNRVTYQPRIERRANLKRNDSALQTTGTLILRIDGRPVDLSGGPVTLSSGGRVLKTAAPGGVQVQIPGGTTVTITPGFWAPYQIAFLNVDVRHARAVEGVMGAIAPGGWLPALSNGAQLGARPASLNQRYTDLYKEFADSWRVKKEISLFDYEAGLSVGSFDVPGWPGESPKSCKAPPTPGGPAEAPPPAPVSMDEAKKLCAAVKDPDRQRNCIADVAATGENGFAIAYLQTERLASLLMPAPPSLGKPDNNAIAPARNITFTWSQPKARDSLSLTYRHCLWSGDDLYDLNKCSILGERSPNATAGKLASSSTTIKSLKAGKVYFWKVLAEDQNGTIVESETRRLQVR